MEKERYQIIQKLAEGGSGVTSLVWDRHLSKQWVMKEIALQGEGQWEAAQAEISALTAVRMDGIPFLADAWREDNRVYLIMEYLEGVTLECRIADQGALAEQEVIRIGIRLAALLQYLHERSPAVVHGDIKASNVICRENKADSPALLDFGASFLRSGEYESSAFGGCHYTPGYAAPELVRTGRASEQTDIYAFGVLLYVMATGELPGDREWEPGPVREQNPFLSEQLEEIIAKCVERDPQKRYHTMEEARLALAACENPVSQKKMGKAQYRRAGRRLFQRVTSLLYTEGKTGIRTLPAVVVIWVCTILFLVANVSGVEESMASGKTLPVNLRNQSGGKFLVDYGTVYHTEQNPIFELPQSCFLKQRKYEITLRQKDCVDGSVRERTFFICME